MKNPDDAGVIQKIDRAQSSPPVKTAMRCNKCMNKLKMLRYKPTVALM
jgi:hypothetical protein